MIVAVLVLLALVLLGAMLVVWYDGRESRHALQSQLQALDARLSAGVSGVQQSLASSLTGTAATMHSVDQQLGQLSESTRQMLEVGRDISGLQQMLRAPKARGQLGELLLERLLADVLPNDNFALQHRFRNGTIVDAAVLIGGGLVPIDAKFPDAAFRRIIDADSDAARGLARREFARDVRGHIDDVSKYILADEGTFGFALMYIPAENVYYEAMIRDEAGDLQAYAQAKRVIACSPNTLFAYLQALVLGLKGLRVEERAREIVAHLERLNDDFARFRREFDTLGAHITHAKAKYDELDRGAIKFADRLARPLEHDWSPLPTPIEEGEPARLIP